MRSQYFDESGKITPEGLRRMKLVAYKAMGIPISHQHLELEHFRTNQDSNNNPLGPAETKVKEKALAFTRKYIEQIGGILSGAKLVVESSSSKQTLSSNNIIYHGGTSSGKTLLGVVILKEAIPHSHNYNLGFYDWDELVDTLSNFNEPDTVQRLEREMKSKDLIVIDGVTVGGDEYKKLNSYFRQKFDAIISARLRKGQPSIWTTSCFPSDMMSQLGNQGKAFIRDAFIVPLPTSGDETELKEID